MNHKLFISNLIKYHLLWIKHLIFFKIIHFKIMICLYSLQRAKFKEKDKKVINGAPLKETATFHY